MGAPSVTLNAVGFAEREIHDMSEDKKPQGRPSVPGGPTKPIGVRPKPHVRKALDKYIADQEVEVSAPAVLAAALEEFLRKRSYLEPDDE